MLVKRDFMYMVDFQENNGAMESILSAKFLMVARDPGNKV